MCNEVRRIQHFINHWQGHSVDELLPDYVMVRFPYKRVIPGHCLVCGRPLSYQEMWPKGRCPRSMCEICYQREIAGKINYRCFVSGDPLPKRKIHAQQMNPREVENNLAEGHARDYYTLLASKVVGIDMKFIKDEIFEYPMPYSDSDCEEICCKLPARHPQALPSSRKEKRALPPPPKSLMLQHQTKELFDLAPTKTTYKGKVIRHVPLWRGKKWS